MVGTGGGSVFCTRCVASSVWTPGPAAHDSAVTVRPATPPTRAARSSGTPHGWRRYSVPPDTRFCPSGSAGFGRSGRTERASGEGDELQPAGAEEVDGAVGHQQDRGAVAGGATKSGRGSPAPSHPASRPAPRRPCCGRGGSRLLVGSSSSSTLWRPHTSWASASLVFFSPPDNVPVSWWALSPLRPNIPSTPRSNVS